MSIDVQNRSAVLRYDGAELWPVGEVGGPYDIARLDLREDLIYRRVWCAIWANPNTTGLPRFNCALSITTETGSEIEWMKWRIAYGEDSIGPIFLNETPPLFARPPYAVTLDDSEPDKSTSPHSGAGDARVIQILDPEFGGRKFRCTMWPMTLSGRFRRIRFTISNFSVGGSPDLSGNIYAGFVVQSQANQF